MKRRVILFALLFHSIIFYFSTSFSDDLLNVEASIVPRKISRGEEGAIILKLSLEPGTIISPHPDFVIEFKPIEELVFPKNFFTASDLEINILEKDGEESLDFAAPLKIPFTVSLKAKKGSHILEGKIKYFARSKKEGWCVKNAAKFFATFYARPAGAKKKTTS